MKSREHKVNISSACGQDCANDCSAICQEAASAELSPIDLATAQGRFEAEATRGICITDHYRMPFYVWGNGPPIVFIHGVGDSSRSFLLPIASLSHHFRCIAYDQPTGQSDGSRLRRFTHENLVRDFFGLLDHLGIARSYVLGSSFGSTIALRALASEPKRLPRAVLQGGFARRPLRSVERWLARIGQFVPGTMGRFRGRERVLQKVHGSEFAGRPPENWRYFIDQTGAAGIAMFARQALMLDKIDLRQQLSEIHQPILLVSGDRDNVVPKACSDELLEGLPNCRRVTLQGCGHIPAYTHPEAFAEIVRNFFTPTG